MQEMDRNLGCRDLDRKVCLIQYAGAVIWPSFLLACAATFFFFAMFDPLDLGPLTAWQITISRELGYTLGFFLFWLLTGASSVVTAWLIYGSHTLSESRKI